MGRSPTKRRQPTDPKEMSAAKTEAPAKSEWTPPKTRIACPSFPKRDPVADVVFDRLEPEAVLAKVFSRDGVQVTGLKLSDTPLNYLMFRVEPSKRIHQHQYDAAMRYRTIVDAMGATGASNTNTIIQTLLKTVDMTPEEKARKESGAEIMSCHDDARQLVDTSSRMLRNAYALREVTSRLDPLDRSVLDDLILRERPLGMIGQRWGWPPDGVGTVVRIALWRLARIIAEVDREYEALVVLYRQLESDDKNALS